MTTTTTTSDQDLLITKATVILDKPSDWTDWLFLRKDSADRNGLWQYVDPDLSKDKVKKQGKEPAVKTLAEYFPNATRDADGDVDASSLSEAQLTTYGTYIRVAEQQWNKWKAFHQLLQDLSTEIGKTIARRHIHLIADASAPYDRLVLLKTHFSESTPERAHQLRARMRSLMIRPKHGPIESWIEQWKEVTRLIKNAKMPEADGTQLQEAFILAVKPSDEGWATEELARLIRSENKSQEYTKIDDLLAEYSSWCRRTRPIQTGLGTFATLQVAEDQSATTGNNAGTPGNSQRAKRQDQSDWVPTCLCGVKHRFPDCPYVAKSKRSKGWTADPDVEKKFKDLREKPETNATARALRAALKKAKGKNKVDAVAVDDGQEPDEESRVNAVLQSNAIANVDTTTVLPELSNRWILDPGSNTHHVWAGGSRLRIEEWGKVDLQVTDTDGEMIKLTLSWVAYIPEMFVSLMSLSRCRRMGIHFDSGRDCLYMGKPSDILCMLKLHGGHWILDADDNDRPKLDQLAVNAVN
ncbi:hypothetical protein EJ04DRAFT_609078, partial [Polyplosphaeria fusca]